jgi:hypothetical protein
MVNHVPEIILNKSIVKRGLVVAVSCGIIIILKSVLWIIQGCHVSLTNGSHEIVTITRGLSLPVIYVLI